MTQLRNVEASIFQTRNGSCVLGMGSKTYWDTLGGNLRERKLQDWIHNYLLALLEQMAPHCMPRNLQCQ